MLGVSSLGVLGVIMAGWASNSNYPLMGSLRSGAQMVSYEIAMSMAVVSAVMMTSMATGTGTLSMIGIVQAQMQQHVWFAFSFFPVGLDRTCGIRHRDGGGNQSRPLRSAGGRKRTGGRLL